MIQTQSVKQFSFQVDSSIVKYAYTHMDNYLIEDYCLNLEPTPLCAIYFSGNSIYYPNDEETFRRTIIERNRFEWYQLRYPNASRHIYIRDIFKQWYLGGINDKINSLDALLCWIKEKTNGYRVVTIGSSAGGYAAVVLGNLLNAERVLAFSPRMEMKSLLTNSTPNKSPLFFRYYEKAIELDWMDVNNKLIKNNTKIFCFYPTKSDLDSIQLSHIKKSGLLNNKNIHIIRFVTSKHGVPFPKVAIKKIFAKTDRELIHYARKSHSPYWFTINLVGLLKGNIGICKQYINYLRRKLNKW